MKRLRALHIFGLDLDSAASTMEAVVLRRALERLRQAHPGIVIDAVYLAGFQDEGNFVPWSHSMAWGPFNDKTLADRCDLDSFLGFVIGF
jgi:hypothetical protein